MITAAKPLGERIRTTLRNSPFANCFARVEVNAREDNGSVELTGEVSSFYYKQLATEAIRRVSGVEHLANRLDVS